MVPNIELDMGLWIQRSNQLKREDNGSPDNEKFWRSPDDDEESDGDMEDPRNTEEWKIQKVKGFSKDCPNKIRLTKTNPEENSSIESKKGKVSKTKKRNSTEPMFDDIKILSEEQVDFTTPLDTVRAQEKVLNWNAQEILMECTSNIETEHLQNIKFGD